MEAKLLYQPDDADTRVYGALTAMISGLRNFCSGAVMSSFNATCYGKASQVLANPRPKAYKKCESFKEYQEYYGTRGIYAVPEEHAYLFFLEHVYAKAAHGNAGGKEVMVPAHDNYNMWSGRDWATKTWFIADRMTGRGYPDAELSCSKFMKFFSAPGMGYTYGRMVCSPLAPGAHGGQCSGGVWAPNLPYLGERLETALAELNAHAEALVDIYGVHEQPKDAIGRLY